LKLTAATGVDELHIDGFPGHDLCFVIRNALLLLGGSEFLDLTIVTELVWLRCANRVRFDRVRRPIHDVYFAPTGLPTRNAGGKVLVSSSTQC
jgi:hypothetical protein